MVTWQLTVDANDPARLARFWAPVLGYEFAPPPQGFTSWTRWYAHVGVPDHELAGLPEDFCDRLRDPEGRGPSIWFQIVPEGKTGKNRLHLDVYPTGGDRRLPLEDRRRIVEARVAELVDAGATVGRRAGENAGYFVVMHDPEGNEFCVG